jgi:hypothetical protein
MWLQKLFYRIAITVMGILAGLFALMTVAVVIKQITDWLKYAAWPPFTIADALQEFGIPRPYTPNLFGFQKLIDSVLDWPGIVALLPVALSASSRQNISAILWPESKIWLDASDNRLGAKLPNGKTGAGKRERPKPTSTSKQFEEMLRTTNKGGIDRKGSW